MSSVAAIMPSQVTCRSSLVRCIGHWEGWSPLLPSSYRTKGGILSSRTYLHTHLGTVFYKLCAQHAQCGHSAQYAPTHAEVELIRLF